jgi:Na+(H+)/acetate symporter ActP
MSAWEIGSAPPAPRSQRRRLRGEPTGSGEGTQEFVDRLTKWIPGDVLAVYVAGVTALSAQAHGKPSIVFLVVATVLAPALVLGGAWSKGTPIGAPTWASAGLAALAFLIWSLTVPFSGWQGWTLVADNRAGVAICAGIAGILFGLFADGVVRRVTPPAKPAGFGGS